MYNPRQKLYVDIFDHDFLSADDHICAGEWEITDLLGDFWFDIDTVESGSAAGSELGIKPRIRIRGTKLHLLEAKPKPTQKLKKVQTDGNILTSLTGGVGQAMTATMGAGQAVAGGMGAMAGGMAGGAAQMFDTLSGRDDADAARARREAERKKKLSKKERKERQIADRDWLLEIKIYGAVGCRAAKIKSVILKLLVEGETVETVQSVKGSLREATGGAGVQESHKNSAKKTTVPVPRETVQQLKFAGYNSDKIASFLECERDDVEEELRGAHEEIWCQTFFQFVRDPNTAKLTSRVGGYIASGVKGKKGQKDKHKVVRDKPPGFAKRLQRAV